jgi:N-acetylglucosaminyldiphosphoundecaprenol N-acetyl-beta-D-mannosaminyltransferase
MPLLAGVVLDMTNSKPASQRNPTRTTPFRAEFASVRILGAPVSVVSMTSVLKLFESWVANRRDRFVVIRDVHGVMQARQNEKVRAAHENCDLMTPDGVPLVWFAKMAGAKDISRVCGPDLLEAACRHGLPFGWRHYFLGGTPDIAGALTVRLESKFPRLNVVGVQCPPFRELTAQEDEQLCSDIRAAKADFVWVSYGTPKQEIWMHEHMGRCGGAVLLGVGAAFAVCSGRRSRAPMWMQEYGLEWLFRLGQEPRRIWKRYLVLAPKFLWLATIEAVERRFKTIGPRREPY